MPKKVNKELHAPLPLNELRNWIKSDETYEWLKAGDAKEAAFQEQMEEEGGNQILDLFSNNNDDHDDDSDEEEVDGDDDASDHSDADFEGYFGRIRVWTSSTTNIDGIGGMYDGIVMEKNTNGIDEDIDNKGNERYEIEEENDTTSIRIVYIVSESWEGYGDLLWASSRHLANLFADPIKCQTLLQPLWLDNRKPITTIGDDGNDTTKMTGNSKDRNHVKNHPLHNLRVLELGAGCGVPSIVAMKCGAKVVCTDLDDTNRIRSIAESLERNWREMNHDKYPNAQYAKACPFRWGTSTEPVVECLKVPVQEQQDNENTEQEDTQERFDVICATDCLFMPWLHYDLLTGIDELLTTDGVAIMAFAIHESFSKDEQVWPFVDKAKERKFHVEILPAVQLTPPKKGMPLKQGLVNMLRLTREEVQQ